MEIAFFKSVLTHSMCKYYRFFLFSQISKLFAWDCHMAFGVQTLTVFINIIPQCFIYLFAIEMHFFKKINHIFRDVEVSLVLTLWFFQPSQHLAVNYNSFCKFKKISLLGVHKDFMSFFLIYLPSFSLALKY